MAENQVATYSNKPISEKQKSEEFQEHNRTYKGFLEMAKWSCIVIGIILIALYFIFIH
ncbi:aa3-type cytochrome c oxidase subunit IV [Pelagibacterium lentulum]|uniref:Cytochrome c oxidase subunit IV bacterial aa3 type domain-containing protein n=1 Tax=Pelagibacterium lentulum TaxID=2029865 RepID=A0A916W172_9HYPH|nr:aa3-type cytochrome c oxidase subunit IV [Pelagibacterium lentulum]GGA58441.1 hypothetical protein GCM10011499_30710 [Pelagibacterium lentulum]